MFDLLLINPIINILVAILHVLFFLHVPYALGFSIIALTVLIRVLLYPLMGTQMKTTKKLQELSPHLSRLKEQYKNDAKKLQEQTMALYKTQGINPAAGCLPILIQLPLFFALYSVIQKIVSKEALDVINHVVYFDWLKVSEIGNTTFFGLPLGQTPSQLFQSAGILIVLIPIITGVLQLIQSKMMMTQPAITNPVKKGKDTKPSKGDDFAKALQMQTTYLLPVMIGFFSYSFPIGLSLYWNTFSIFGIIQQYRLQGLGNLAAWLPKGKKLNKQIWQKKKKN